MKQKKTDEEIIASFMLGFYSFLEKNSFRIFLLFVSSFFFGFIIGLFLGVIL